MATERVSYRTVVDGRKVRRAIRQFQIGVGVPLHRADVPVDSCAGSFRACAVCNEHGTGGAHKAGVS